MAEAAKVRLVRCPQCENLLPEPPDFSVYQCGGCGAVLRAKNKGLVDDGISGKYDEDKNGGVSGNAGLVTDFGAERGNNVVGDGKVEGNLNENGIFNSSSSSSVPEDKGIPVNSSRQRRGIERIDARTDNGLVGIMDNEYGHSSKASQDNSVRDSTNCGLNMKRPTYVNSNNDNGLEEDLFVGSLRSRPAMNQKSVGRISSVASLANTNGASEPRSFAKFPYPDEGTSNYGRGSLYNYDDYMTYGDHLDGLARVEKLENDRTELLRKLDELADQLSKSCDIPEKPRERSFRDRRIPPVPLDSYSKHDVFAQEGGSIPYGVNKHPLGPDKHIPRPPYFPHSHGYPFVDRHGSAVQEPPYSSTNRMHEYRGFPDAYPRKMPRRPSHQLPRQYFEESDYEHFPGHYMDFHQDLFMSHQHETFFHQPACSCLHCFNKNWHAPKMQPPTFSSQNSGINYMRGPYPPANPVNYGLQGYISEGCSLQQPHSRDRQLLTRSSSDLGRDTGGFRPRFKKVVVPHGNGRIFHPVAGGAPFVTCCNCSELLKLPRKIMSVQNNRRKMKCGACSSILLFGIEGKEIVLSIPVETEPFATNIISAANEIPAENFRNFNDFSDTCAINSSNEYENFNFDFQLADDEPNPSLVNRRSDFGASDTKQDPHSSSSSFSDDEESPDSLILGKDVSHFAKDEACLPLPDSHAQEYPDHPSSDEVIQRNVQGNQSKCIDHDKNIQDGVISRQNSLKEALVVATEMDVSYNDHSSTVVSRDSVEVRKDEDRSKSNKGRESFLVGLIKKRLGDFSKSSKSTESGKSNVSVNGHFIPDRVVKKAEKLAGSIQPGDYWYDFRAGFWGVMGHPCLGIIPPNIDVFDYPIPQDCSRGNTSVFVNARELHQKDLDLLACRGLPTMRNKSYLVEISGRVVDELTGEELDSLGKLAPTVERAKHGFGMKVPKSLLQEQQQQS